MTKPRKPPKLGAAGSRLWGDILAKYELDPHELLILTQAARTADTVAALDDLVRDEGEMVESPQGRKVHPALVEARQQRVTLARLLAALRIPVEGAGTPPVRAPRGVYQLGDVG